jgi:hypothetical protein
MATATMNRAVAARLHFAVAVDRHFIFLLDG